MRVGVKVFATLTRYFPSLPLGAVMSVELDEGATFGDLLLRIGIPHKEVKLALLNGIPCTIDQVLQDGDTLSLFPAIGGG